MSPDIAIRRATKRWYPNAPSERGGVQLDHQQSAHFLTSSLDSANEG